MTVDPLDGRFGEGWGGDSPDGAHVNVVLARRGSPTAAAAAGALASPAPGHTPIVVCHGPNHAVRPVTVMVNKTTVDSDFMGALTWGAGQLGVGQGVLDAVADGLLDPGEAGEIVILLALWIDPEAGDETALKRAAREATRRALADALEGGAPAAVQELLAARETATNGFYGGA